ncbi:aldo/keto reductase [Roseibium marinum]|uniref:2,5-diketo-D-gluconate reductase B n=1 Tax=Roseibium marinum TaxID=281252 RepID=A0A2S3UQS8_9HYPH|nr:aldo/keto reductase [Roseibium marinum]POF30034.1 2,5-diketo-D-gluconate reductase B [Roseibium marinum]
MHKIKGLMPGLGFGTYGRVGEDGIEAIRFALECGYRHLDTAQSYGTESEVGSAVRRSGLDRDEVFVTTKVGSSHLGPGRLIASLEDSLRRLEMDVVDLTLIHWPSPNGEIPLAVYLEQLAEAKEKGLTKSIGVSNFTIALLKEAETIVGKSQLLTNQVELNPLFQNRKLAEYCEELGISVTCYRPLAQGELLDNPVLQAIAENQDATASQVALAWELAKGYAAIPTSSSRERIANNFAAGDVTLSAQDMTAIEGVKQIDRAIDPAWGPDWD